MGFKTGRAALQNECGPSQPLEPHCARIPCLLCLPHEAIVCTVYFDRPPKRASFSAHLLILRSAVRRKSYRPSPACEQDSKGGRNARATQLAPKGTLEPSL